MFPGRRRAEGVGDVTRFFFCYNLRARWLWVTSCFVRFEGGLLHLLRCITYSTFSALVMVRFCMGAMGMAMGSLLIISLAGSSLGGLLVDVSALAPRAQQVCANAPTVVAGT